MNDIHITGRIGSTPQQRGSSGGANCPDIFKLADGSYLVIGEVRWASTEMNVMLAEHGARIGSNEIGVIVPARVLEDAARDLHNGTVKGNA